MPIDSEEAQQVMNMADYMAVFPPGVLYRCVHKVNKGQKYARLRKRIMVPQTLVPKILKLRHNDILIGGHVGVSVLSTKIYWRNMHTDILYYVKSCQTYALRKRAPHYKALAKSWDAPSRPWEMVQCDFIGLLKGAKWVKIYHHFYRSINWMARSVLY